MLSLHQLRSCQEKFNLSYHINFAYQCQQLVGFQGKDVLEVGGSLPKELVLDYLQVKSWSALETPDYDLSLAEVGGSPHQGTIFKDILHVDSTSFGYENRILDSYNLFLAKIEDLPETHYETYDLIFSIAAFEHIHKLPQALEKMYLALRPGGKLFSMFCPVWSAHDGHHLPAITDQQGQRIERGKNCIIPPWGHLLMRPAQLCQYLYQYTDKQTADLLAYYTYNSDHINRFFIEDYLEFIQMSPFDFSLVNRIFSKPPVSLIQQQLEQLHPGRKDFSSNGLMIILTKKLELNSDSLPYPSIAFF